MRFRRQADDHVVRRIFQILECVRLMLLQIDADLVHHGRDERIGPALPHARGRKKDFLAEEMSRDRFRHRRANRVHRTGEEDRLRTTRLLARVHSRSAFPVQSGDEREQPPRSVEIAIDLAFEPLGKQLRAFIV